MEIVIEPALCRMFNCTMSSAGRSSYVNRQLEVLEDLSPDDELMTGLTAIDECLTQNSREVSPSLIAYLVSSATER